MSSIDRIGGKGKDTRFGYGQPTNLGGRKKNLLTRSKLEGYSSDDFKTAFLEVSSMRRSDLEKILDDPEIPDFQKGLARCMINFSNTGDYRLLKDVVQQVIGKPKISIDTPPQEDTEDMCPNIVIGMDMDKKD